MRRNGLLAMALLVAIVMLPSIAMATTLSSGDPVVIGSWAQHFFENGVYAPGPNYYFGPSPTLQSFDNVIAIMRSGAGFESPGISTLDAGWTGVFVSSTEVTASATSLKTTLNNTLYFAGDMSQPFTLDWYVLNGSNVVGAESISWNGCGWSYGEATAPVPLPPSALLMGSGILGLVGLGWRRRQTAA